MALVKCPNCGKDYIPDSTESCPDGGCEIRDYYEKMYKETNAPSDSALSQNDLNTITAILFWLFLMILIVIFFKSCGLLDSSSDDYSPSDDHSGICQFEGCNRKADGSTGEFCSYHEKALDAYWDLEYANN